MDIPLLKDRYLLWIIFNLLMVSWINLYFSHLQFISLFLYNYSILISNYGFPFIPVSWRYFPMLYSRIFLSFFLKLHTHTIYLEFIFVCRMMWSSRFFFPCEYTVKEAPLLKRWFFPLYFPTVLKLVHKCGECICLFQNSLQGNLQYKYPSQNSLQNLSGKLSLNLDIVVSFLML